MAKEKGNKESSKIINTATIGMAQDSLIQQNGEAASQMIQAYKGVRYDSSGNDLGHHGRSLKGISEYKANDPNYQNQNIKQQSGFSAELIKEARDNKEAILNGDSARTRTTDGIGNSNDMQYDHVKVDSNGNPIDNTSSQMKFLKSGIDKDGDRTFKVMDKLAKDKEWDRYDGKIDIPKGDYKDAIKYADKQANKLSEQAKRARELGKNDLADKLEKQAEGYEKAKKRIRESNVSDKEAIEARLNPEKFVAKEVIKDIHNGGVDAAKGAVIMGGAISTAQNLYSIIAEDKPIDEAVKDIAKTTATSGAVAYGVVTTGTALKSMMHSSKKEMIRRMGTTNAPTMIVTGSIEIAKSMKRFANGEIDEMELMQELGEKGTGMVAAGFASSVGAGVGASIGSVVPFLGTAAGATIGAFIGSMIGYSSSSMLYKGALEALNGAQVSGERRIVIEDICRAAVIETEIYREKLLKSAIAENSKREEVFKNLFDDIKKSILSNDMDFFILSVNNVGKEFGVKMEFSSFEEIDQFMLDESTVFSL